MFIRSVIDGFTLKIGSLKKMSLSLTLKLFKWKKPMRPSVAFESKRQDVLEAIGRFRVANARVFGSVVRGTDKDGSDLDLLIDTVPGTTLFDLGGLQDELETILGIKVDVLTTTDLPKRFRERVLNEARPV